MSERERRTAPRRRRGRITTSSPSGMTEALTLVQTGKVLQFPIVLIGTAYWSGLVGWLRQHALAEGKVSAEDLDILHLCDDATDALTHIQDLLARRTEAMEPSDCAPVAAHKGDAQ